MKEDRIRWNRKFDSDKAMPAPSSLVRSFYEMAPGNLVLDLAAGTGRNAIFLARQGLRVIAVDLADQALHRLQALDHPNIVPVQADLDTFPLRPTRFDLILCCHFLDRRLFPFLAESLKPRGVLLFESAIESDQPGFSQPRNRNYLLRTNELLHAFLRLRILLYEEILVRDTQAPKQKKLLARMAAVRDWH